MADWLKGFFLRQPAPYGEGWRRYSQGVLASILTILFLFWVAYSGFWFILGYWWSK